MRAEGYLLSDQLSLHSAAPDFALPADNGELITLKDCLRTGPVLVFFYPADFTPVCTCEVVAFREDFQQYRQRNITIVGISADPVEKHHRFAAECRIPYHLLSDVDHTVARAYGAKGLLGTRRAYYLIGRDGKLLWQHAECLPVFKLSNARILEAIDHAIPPSPTGPAHEPSTGFIPPPHM
ncbi:peroxiredoxin [soil metagenome]